MCCVRQSISRFRSHELKLFLNGAGSRGIAACEGALRVIDCAMPSPPSLFTEENIRIATELGIDLGLLEENLRLTPLERMEQHDACVRQIMETQEQLGVALSDDS